MIIMKNDWNFALWTLQIAVAYCQTNERTNAHSTKIIIRITATPTSDSMQIKRQGDFHIPLLNIPCARSPPFEDEMFGGRVWARTTRNIHIHYVLCTLFLSLSLLLSLACPVLFIFKCVEAIETLHFRNVAIALHSFCFMMASSVGIMIFLTACILSLSPSRFLSLSLSSSYFSSYRNHIVR